MQLADPQSTFDRLTEKHRAVMDLVCNDFEHKEIARRLGISPRTVEQRMAAVREILGTAGRGSTVRAYRQLQRMCGQATYGSPPLDSESFQHLTPLSDAGLGPVFTLRRTPTIGDGLVIAEPLQRRPGAGVVWGRVYRFGLIVFIALCLAGAFALAVATADGLNDLL